MESPCGCVVRVLLSRVLSRSVLSCQRQSHPLPITCSHHATEPLLLPLITCACGIMRHPTQRANREVPALKVSRVIANLLRTGVADLVRQEPALCLRQLMVGLNGGSAVWLRLSRCLVYDSKHVVLWLYGGSAVWGRMRVGVPDSKRRSIG